MSAPESAPAALAGRRLRMVFDALKTGVVVVGDRDGRVHFANRRASLLLDRDDLAGLALAEVVAPLADLRAGCGGGGEQRGERAVLLPDGSWLTLGYTLSAVPAEPPDDEPLTAMVFQDIGAVVRLRDERDRLLQLATVGQAMPTVLHELKNPLASISSAVELLVEESEPGPLQDQLHAVLGEVRRLQLGFDGLGAVGRALRTEAHAAIDLAAEEVIRILAGRAQAAGVELASAVPYLPLLPFDPAVVRAIVFNLVVNAIEACPPGGHVQLSMALADGGGGLLLVVQDDGCGMEPEVAARSTELFFTTKPRGSGIGLALCHRAVEEAGGTLRITSNPGAGTRITVAIPADPRSMPEPEPAPVARRNTMPSLTLFERGDHRNVLLEDFGGGLAVQANQHLIIDGQQAMLLDPGGHKVYSRVLAETISLLRGGIKLSHIFLSHQDPDIVAATNGWLMSTDAEAFVSSLWVRFVPHFGLDRLVESRLHPIPDEGMALPVGGARLLLVPAHFLHSCGNFHVYDPVSRILYSGDLGASIGPAYREVSDFDAHLQYMLGFHRRYMASRKALAAWVAMVRQLDIEMIAPQHGALFRGRELVARFLDWCEGLECGLDLLQLRLPAAD